MKPSRLSIWPWRPWRPALDSASAKSAPGPEPAIDAAPGWTPLYRQAVQLMQQAAFAPAAAQLRQALASFPDPPELHFLLIQALLLAQQPEQAWRHLRAATAAGLPPGAECCYWQGMVLEQLQRPEQALQAYREALELVPEHFDSRLQLARMHAGRHEPGPALAHYRSLLAQTWEVLPEYLLQLEAAGELNEAASACRELVWRFPADLRWRSRWLFYLARSQPQALSREVGELSQAQPELAAALALQGSAALRMVDRLDLARDCLAQLEPGLPDRTVFWLHQQLMCFPLAVSRSEISDYASRAQAALAACEAGAIRLDYRNLDPYLRLWEHLIWLPYFNLEPRPLRQALGQWIQAALPVLPAPEPAPEQTKPALRLGFVINSNSAVRAFLTGVFRDWPAGPAQPVLLYTDPSDLQPELALLRPDLEQLRLSADPVLALQQLRQGRFDLLFYTEVHTDRFNQGFWAAHRLAPVQLTSWLSSGTSGLATLDYFLSSRLLERSESPQTAYSERLLLMQELPCLIAAPVAPAAASRAQYALPDEAHLYLCAHTLFKLHPDFDAVLAALLARDPQAWILLQERPADPFVRARLEVRLQAALAQNNTQGFARVRWLPVMDHPAFLALMQLADVLLDPFYFGGGTTSFEALAFDLPVVTWPGERLHGRITHAYYLKMALPDCIASDPEDYLEKALRLGTDPAANRRVRERIRARKAVIFEQQAPLAELVACLTDLATSRPQAWLAEST
ncbi:MAG: tetratricopeptide repeat protein [Candidatus Sericytochromatia bacterium]